MINDNQNDYELSSNNIVLNHKRLTSTILSCTHHNLFSKKNESKHFHKDKYNHEICNFLVQQEGVIIQFEEYQPQGCWSPQRYGPDLFGNQQ